MAGERRINFGADATDARYAIEDTGNGANFILARDTTGGTVLLEYDDAAGEWVNRGGVDMDGNDISNVGTVNANSVSTDQATIEPEQIDSLTTVVNIGTFKIKSGTRITLSDGEQLTLATSHGGDGASRLLFEVDGASDNAVAIASGVNTSTQASTGLWDTSANGGDYAFFTDIGDLILQNNSGGPEDFSILMLTNK